VELNPDTVRQRLIDQTPFSVKLSITGTLLRAFMSDVRGSEKFADSDRFAFHTANDREGVVRGPTARSRRIQASCDSGGANYGEHSLAC